jgi:hypothetical protein
MKFAAQMLDCVVTRSELIDELEIKLRADENFIKDISRLTCAVDGFLP